VRAAAAPFGRAVAALARIAALVVVAAVAVSALPAGAAWGSPAAAPAPAAAPRGPVVVYSGRIEALVGPILQAFQRSTGIAVRVRYGDTAELASTLVEEGPRSPADVFFAQDAGALGAVAAAGLMEVLPPSSLQRVEPRFRSPRGLWVGVSGRARVVAYSTQRVRPEELPDSILDFTHPRWRGRIGWPPTNGSFQAFVTALRKTAGEETARRWLLGIKANGARAYRNNVAILQAIADGEIDVGFVNHYYLYRFLAERGPSFPVRNYHPRAGDAGAMVNVAGVGVLRTAPHREAALRLVEFLLSPEAQSYFARETYEYPLVAQVPPPEGLVPLAQLRTPDIDLSDLADLQATLNLLWETGVL